MCGRFSLAMEAFIISQRFEVPFGIPEWQPRYNIAPSQRCLAIYMEKNQRVLEPLVWGLIPHWSKDKKSGFQMINARAETLNSKPTFRSLIQTKRCLVPADGFFEWKKTAAGKIPFRVALKSGELFAFAGLWDSWQDENEKVIKSFTIITTEANTLVSQLHDRMPVILKREDEGRWLDPVIHDYDKLEPFFRPYASEGMTLYEVPSLVNSWKNDSPACIHRLD